jgi:lysyl-tRNA synthetase class 2
MASLARLKENGMADRFEVFFRGVELCNGFGELTDPAEQRRRFEQDQAARQAVGAPVYPIDERFLDDLERGMPQSGGNALGVDRLLMLLVGADSIQDVMPFPEERL